MFGVAIICLFFLLKLVRPLSMCTRKSIYIEFNFDPNVGTIFRNDDDLK